MYRYDDEETEMCVDVCEDEKVEHENEIVALCKAECQEWKDKHLHLSADFQNYKKRLTQERAEWGYDSQKVIILDLLPIIDNFERAFAQEKNRDAAGAESLLAGFSLIYQQFEKMLKKYGVQEIIENKVFNPEYHEALMHVDSSEHASGEIIQVIQKGYIFKGHVIRPAQVSVAK